MQKYINLILFIISFIILFSFNNIFHVKEKFNFIEVLFLTVIASILPYYQIYKHKETDFEGDMFLFHVENFMIFFLLCIFYLFENNIDKSKALIFLFFNIFILSMQSFLTLKYILKQHFNLLLIIIYASIGYIIVYGMWYLEIY